MDDGFGAFEGALRGFDGFARNVARVLVCAKFHQASGHNLGQVALFIALGHFNGFVNFSIPQRTCHCRSKGPRLLAGRVECHVAVNHHAEGPSGHDKKNADDDFCQDPHLVPQRKQVESHLLVLENPGGQGGHVS